MAIPKPFRLLIPRKTQKPVDQPDYGTDMRAIEIWAQALVAYIDSLGAGGITDITSTIHGSISITNPTGPTTNLEVAGFPFLPYSDTHQNTGYGFGVNPRGTSGIGNTAVGAGAMTAISSGQDNTALGEDALQLITSSGQNTAVGTAALSALTTSGPGSSAFGSAALGAATAAPNDAFGYQALTATTTGINNCVFGFQGYNTNVSGHDNTAIGFQTNATIGSVSYTTCVGSGTTCGFNGGVAIGIDNTGLGATSPGPNVFTLGTASHYVQIRNNVAGAGTPLFGSNCPATTLTHPYTWFRMLSNDGSVVYVPAWK